MKDAAERWVEKIWPVYCGTFTDYRTKLIDLSSIEPKSKEEEEEFIELLNSFRVGFCIGGACGKTREPKAFEVELNLKLDDKPKVHEIEMGVPMFWGWSNLIYRLTWGIDGALFHEILNSEKWTGTHQDLSDIVRRGVLDPGGNLPIRDAIDWVYSSIYTTIKAIKFSRIDQVCGGPIEIAVVTTDRKFRWVRHKGLDAAIT